MVIFHTPSRTACVAIGMVVSVWRGLKQPKLYAGETPVGERESVKRKTHSWRQYARVHFSISVVQEFKSGYIYIYIHVSMRYMWYHHFLAEGS